MQLQLMSWNPHFALMKQCAALTTGRKKGNPGAPQITEHFTSVSVCHLANGAEKIRGVMLVNHSDAAVINTTEKPIWKRVKAKFE